MKICTDHWQTMKETIEAKGLGSLISKSGEAVIDAEVRQLEEAKNTGSVSEQTTKETFDPLMSMHWHFTNYALECGGLYLMCQNEDGKNEGQYCPVCEFEKHSEGFIAKDQITSVADQMRDYCIKEGLIPRLS